MREVVRMKALLEKHCKACKPGAKPLDQSAVRDLLRQIDGWQVSAQSIAKTFRFKDYYQTISFVNAIAWLAHMEDHHPQLTVNFNNCLVEYSTHAAHGLTENDFICAAKVDALFGSTT